MKRDRFGEQRKEYQMEKDQVVKSISELRTALSNPNIVQYTDPKSKQVITTTSTANRKAFERQLSDAVARRDKISERIEVLSDSLATVDVKIVEIQAASTVSAELGPLKYLSGLTGQPMDRIVNWFLMLLIFVFDPLAVVLVILANFSFERAYGGDFWSVVHKTPNRHQKTPQKPVEEVLEDEQHNENFSTEDSDPIVVRQEDDQPIVVDKTLPQHIRDAMPWITSKKILSDAQKRNMTHEEIEQWYRDNML
jgi:hypothetical protein